MTTRTDFATPRRRIYDVPADTPPERVRSTLRAEVEYSLRDVCGNWPTGEFDRIVADVTSTAMKYQGHERRRQNSAAQKTAARIPGMSVIVAILSAAMQSIQKFFQLETLPLS